jgi:CheY-like chemotaxis protein
MIPKILLVDDVSMFLELQKSFLKVTSVRILTAKDGVEALQVVKKERPSLIFMDLHMPNMDGAECCSRLKADPEFRSLPVIMVTSEGKDAERDLCFKAGCDDFLTKPLDRILFLETARKYLPAIDRRDPRIPCREKAKFKAFGLTLSGEVLDLSANGTYLATDYAVRAGTMLEIEFSLPDGKRTVIQTRGNVAWMNSREARKNPKLPAGFGVEFVGLNEEAREALRLFVEKQM